MSRRVITAMAVLLCALAAQASPYYDGRAHEAVSYYEREAEKNPSDKFNWYELASAAKEEGENRKAFNAYRKIIEIHPQEIRAHFELAKMYYFLGALNYAEAELKYLESRNTVNWEVNYWRGCVYLGMCDYPQAELFLKRAAEMSPNKAVVSLKLAECMEKAGDLKAASSYLEETMKKDRTYTELLEKKALLAEMMGEKLTAYTAWRKLGEVEEDNIKSRNKVAVYTEIVPEIKQKVEAQKEKKKAIRMSHVPPDKLPPVSAINSPRVRVGILKEVPGLVFKCGSDFELINGDNEVLYAGAKLSEYTADYGEGGILIKGPEGDKKAGKKITLRKKDAKATTSVQDIKYGAGFFWAGSEDSDFRGELEFVTGAKGINLINILSTEEYLYGVVPAEVPSYWPREALKAMAVSARTYTMAHFGQHKKDGFDLCSNQHCAVYKGAGSENKNVNECVDLTAYEVLLDKKGRLLPTFYSECCGGHTQDVSEVWGMRKIEELRGVYDGGKKDFEFPLSPFDAEEWVRTMPDTYCRAEGSNETSFRWIRCLSGEYLAHYVNRKNKLGRIIKIEPLSRGKTGAVIRIRITGENGSAEFKFDSIRNVLGKLRSNVVKWEYRLNEQGFIEEIYIYGAGWGHGVGVCQRGLRGMADSGRNYGDILRHYYPGASVARKYQEEN